MAYLSVLTAGEHAYQPGRAWHLNLAFDSSHVVAMALILVLITGLGMSAPVASLAPFGDATVQVSDVVETGPAPPVEDAAHDVAMWINPIDSSQSAVIGTHPQDGLGVSDLTGGGHNRDLGLRRVRGRY